MLPLFSVLRFPARDLGFLSAYAFAALLLVGTLLFGPAEVGVVVTFVLIPVADFVLGRDRANARRVEADVEQAIFYRVVLYAWLPVQILILTLAISRVVATNPSFVELVSLALPVGFLNGGIGITVAHELGHRHVRISQFFARSLLLSVGYAHFVIEHNRGHHLRVATPTDPATARFGEGFWAFLPRTVIRQYQHAWKLENARLRAKGLSPFHWQNEMVWFLTIPIMIVVVLGVLFGAKAAMFFVLQAMIAVGLLEAVNYIEHYGLVRREITKGVYEKVNILHSWNANFLLTNFLLFKLQRHADHHAFAGRRYQILRHIDEAPQLPAGYPTMVLMALCPPLFKYVMEPRVRIARARTGVDMTVNRV